MGQETAGRVVILSRERAVRSRQGSIRKSRGPEHGKGLGCDVRAELAPGRLSNGVPGQSQRTWQSQTRRHAELVDTGGFQVWPVRHEDGWHDCASSLPDGKAAAEVKSRATHGPHGLRVHENRCSDTEMVDQGERHSVRGAETISSRVLLRHAMC